MNNFQHNLLNLIFVVVVHFPPLPVGHYMSIGSSRGREDIDTKLSEILSRAMRFGNTVGWVWVSHSHESYHLNPANCAHVRTKRPHITIMQQHTDRLTDRSAGGDGKTDSTNCEGGKSCRCLTFRLLKGRRDSEMKRHTKHIGTFQG